ncbi:DUF4267 domain-containing protein [Kitasatospora sp. NPDC006697]|uniref:DUF4267 domain-containing protein n=1 Tax=Kitasatospora sp. NPDC006697 TaxID=3364020 RepID=UPI0036BC60D2
MPVHNSAFQSGRRGEGTPRDRLRAFAFVLMLVAGSYLLGWCSLTLAAVPAGDALVVLHGGGSPATAYGLHAATVLVMALIGIGLPVRPGNRGRRNPDAPARRPG